MPPAGPGLTRRCLVCALPASATAPLLAAAPAHAKGKKIIKTKKVKKGRIVAKRGVVVTQTKKGRFRVFSAKNGFLLAGPATKDLPPIAFVIEKGVIYLA